MPPSSSPPSSSLKRKQQTISSFFKKASSTATTGTGTNGAKTNGDTDQEDKRTAQIKDDAAKPATVGADHRDDDDDDDDDDVVLPARKRTKVVEYEPTPDRPAEEPIPTSQISSSRTERFKFTSSPATNDANGARAKDGSVKSKEKEKLHQKFVRKLGGPDCVIGIGKSVLEEEDMALAEDNVDEEEEAPPPPAKGKAVKKGASKLTPMEKQVVEIKRKHMDTLLVVEVGYKFRFFGEDARIAAKELSIVCIPGKLRFDERTSLNDSVLLFMSLIGCV